MLLALIPTYGLWLVFASVTITCLAVPFPSSMLVMTAGGFAAAGDFTYGNVVLFAFVGFALGDQLAFFIARRTGVPLITNLKSRAKLGPMVERAEVLMERHDAAAVILTRTFLSPLGPYVAFLSGALKAPWLRFSVASVIGAAVWCAGYTALGYVFTSQISELADLIGSAVGIVIAASIMVAILVWVIANYRHS
jgi:membrane protein DedA with SNARE-associated domain